MSASSVYSVSAEAVHRSPVSWPKRLALAVLHLAWTVARERRLRRDMRALAQLDDTMLRDIGASRGEVEDLVRHGRGRRAGPMLVALSRVHPHPARPGPSASTDWR